MGIIFRPHAGDFTILKGPPPSKGSATPCSIQVGDDEFVSSQCYPTTSWGEFVGNKLAGSISEEDLKKLDFLGAFGTYESAQNEIRVYKADGPWAYPAAVPLQKYLSWFSTTSWSIDLNLSITNKLAGRNCIQCQGAGCHPTFNETFSSCNGGNPLVQCFPVGSYTEQTREEVLTASLNTSISAGSDQSGPGVWYAGVHCRESSAPPLLIGQIDKIARDEDGKPITFSSNGRTIGKPNYIGLRGVSVGSWSQEKGCENGEASSGASKVFEQGVLYLAIEMYIFNRFFISEDRQTCWPRISLAISWQKLSAGANPSSSTDPGIPFRPAGDPRYVNIGSYPLASTIGVFDLDALVHGTNTAFGTPSMSFTIDGISIPIYWNGLLPSILFRAIEDPYSPPSSSEGSLNLKIDPVSYASYS